MQVNIKKKKEKREAFKVDFMRNVKDTEIK